jgi:hypothetical protein
MIRDFLFNFKSNPNRKAFYFLWRFMIAAKYEGKEYGKEAMRLIIIT